MNENVIEAYTHGIVLAPMAGSTDSAFRRLCRRMGATAVVTEMVAAAGLSRKSAKTCRYLRFTPEEKPIGVQLFGNTPIDFERSAALVSDMGFDFIDINAGCPVKKVARSGSGSSLLKDIPKLTALVRATVSGTSLPVTVKIRLGWSPEEPVPDALPRLLADEGAVAIAVHGRYRSDMFSGKVRKEGIERIVRNSPIPVLANGESTSVQSALDLRDSTGATGLLIGRGALGNPWLFRGLISGDPSKAIPASTEYREIIMEHLSMMKEYVPTEYVYHILRGHLVNYLRGFRGASALREKAVRINSDQQVEELIREMEIALSEEGMPEK